MSADKGFVFKVNREYAVGEVIKRRSKKWRVVPDERWIVTSVADAVNWGWLSKPGEIVRAYEEKMVNAAVIGIGDPAMMIDSAMRAFSDKYMSVIKEGTGEEGTAVYVPYKKK